MGNFESVEFIEGQSATGKRQYFDHQKTKLHCYSFIHSNSVSVQKLHCFSSERDCNVLSLSQGGVALDYWISIVNFVLTNIEISKTKLLVYRSPLSSLLYDFLFKTFIPAVRSYVKARHWEDYPAHSVLDSALKHDATVKDEVHHFKKAIDSVYALLLHFVDGKNLDINIYLHFLDWNTPSAVDFITTRQNLDETRLDAWPSNLCEDDPDYMLTKFYVPCELYLWHLVHERSIVTVPSDSRFSVQRVANYSIHNSDILIGDDFLLSQAISH
jgi:hypothetical protein